MRQLGSPAPLDAQTALEILADAFARYLSIWRLSGLGAIVRQWETHAHPRGTALSAKLPDGEAVDGLYVGLDNDGALRLRLADGSIRAIHAADVFLV